ncbi:MAG: hypothetical protein HY961_07735 [Ignavibacteriae bacterium]|nr:hypothetical protein [Ignavibacteriota bacterium]
MATLLRQLTNGVSFDNPAFEPDAQLPILHLPIGPSEGTTAATAEPSLFAVATCPVASHQR